MKAPDGYFQRKNSKKGLALSTSMAICIVLAILVAVLVSMASLNITTTQATVSQREAYIQAKSALAFAESYYSQHDIPGKDEIDGGEALMVFNTDTVSEGAKVYVTKLNGVSTGVDEDQLRQDCIDTYVDVVKSGDFLDLTAHCKYGDDNYYELSKEFNLGVDRDIQPNAFTGNVTYQATSDTRYLRIHVRTNPAFDGYPFLYTWFTSVNKVDNATQMGRSSIVNKMSEDTSYATISNGVWDGAGPSGNCAMVYEGNGWYVTEVKVATDNSVNFVNAIVTKNNAARANGNNQQSWEFFGIPVPSDDKPGSGNGLDVYITLNRNELRDARNYNGGSTDANSAPEDEFTHIFEADCSSNVDEFARFCGSWYTVYTKKDTSTMHYRKQGVYDDSANPGGGFEYEGHGWYRRTSTNFSDTVAGISFGSAHTVSQNIYGKEIVKEGFVCDFTDGGAHLYDSEADANDAFYLAGDIDAGKYVTVNVKGSRQPVNDQVETTLSYSSYKRNESSGSSTPTPEPTSNSNSELKFRNLASGDGGSLEYCLIGDDKLNNWGLADDGKHYYQNLDYNKFKLEQTGTGTFEARIKYSQAGEYKFKVIERKKDSGCIDDPVEGDSNGWAWAYGGWVEPGRTGDTDGNAVYEVKVEGNTLVVVFNANTHAIENVYEENPNGPIENPGDYAVIGWCNDWGTKAVDGTIYTAADFAATDKMTYDADAGVFTYVADRTTDFVESGKTYTFKVIKLANPTGTITADHYKEAYGDNENKTQDYIFTPPETAEGKSATYKITITFDPIKKENKIKYDYTGVPGEKFYIIGNFNNWASDHTFSKATRDVYELRSTGNMDELGRYIYTGTPEEDFDPENYEVKVISSSSLKANANPEDKDSIDYANSWGETDSEGLTYGTSKAGGENRSGFKFDITSRSKVEFTFYYDTTNMKASTITFKPVPGDNVETVQYKFRNEKTTYKGTQTDFTAWEKLYVTYYKEGLPVCKQISFNEGTKLISVSIPKDGEKFYFSNMDSTTDDRKDPKYECTITFKIDDVPKSSTLIPTQIITDPDSSSTTGKSWELKFDDGGDADPFSDTVKMVYTGSLQNNYYDAPLVKVLNMIVSKGRPDGGGTKYAFSAFPYQDNGGFDVKTVGKVLFNPNDYITYQGEKYYYVAGKAYSGKYSFLIVQDSTKKKGGILLENHMALMTDVYGTSQTKMNNRGGGVFTSDNAYYDGSASPFNYGGYTPNWYTYKMTVADEEDVPDGKDPGFLINNIKGLVSSGEKIVDNSGGKYVVPAKATDHYNQPLYIVQEYANTTGDDQVERYYTYNTNLGSVDTNTANEVSVYFDNSAGDFSKVSVYAEDPLGNSTKQELPIDGTDADHSYNIFTFTSGQYCYFTFFDPTTGDIGDEDTKQTKKLYLTGNETANHEYDILAVGMNATAFTPYVHPRTQALYAAIALESAAASSRISSAYSYSVKTGVYESLSTYEMAGIKSQAVSARNYANNGSGGKWSATDPTAYNQLAVTVQEFVETIQNTRIYIGDTMPAEDPTSTKVLKNGDSLDGKQYNRVYKEASYRDNVFNYKSSWVNLLGSFYDQAVEAFSNTSMQNTGTLQGYIATLNGLIANPLTEPNENTVQIIVDDQVITSTDDEGNVTRSTPWGKANIHIYTCDSSNNNWKEAGYDLYDTTQSSEGFYAYVFLPKTETMNYMIAQAPPADGTEPKVVEVGKRYTFHTASNSFSDDKSVAIYRITQDVIDQNGITKEYNKFDARSGDKAVILYFLYDTQVKCSSGNYTIYAGAYTISSSYAGFDSDVSDETYSDGKPRKGIDLFTETAKNYFEQPGNYGMSLSSSTSYTNWSVNIPDEGKNIDIMCEGINITPSVSASTSSNKKISFRYKANKDDDTLTLNQNVSFDAGTVVIAANTIDLNSFDVSITAKTIVFRTDTTVVTSHGEFKISNGTYVFNESDSKTGHTVSLESTGNTPDWREHYTLISESGSKLRGGYYIAHT